MSDSPSVPSPSAAGSTVSQRPVSKAEAQNPREFQINQLRRRFRPVEKEDDSGTLLTFGLVPSDPDFPFELDQLRCILHIPRFYPDQQRPTLKVTNPEMDTAFQDNVGRGFNDIVNATMGFNRRGTLLGWMNTLDKQLERLLTTTERGPTLKFVTVPNETAENMESRPEQKRPQTAGPVFTAEEKAQAEKRRATETKQIDARLNRLPLFQKLPDGVSFIIPIQPTKLDRLPAPLRSVKTVKLVVPQSYPLEPSSIELQGVGRSDALPVEAGFSRWAKENANLNLMSQINYLASNMHSFAKTPLEAPASIVSETPKPDSNIPQEPPQATGTKPAAESEDRPHLHVIPRPPEWTIDDTASGSDDDITDESFSEDDSEDDEDGGAPVPEPTEPTTERGVALSFPSLEFYGIELLELIALSITIKCERCKELMDVKNVPQTKDKSDAFSPRVETCKKCTNSMSIGNISTLLLTILGDGNLTVIGFRRQLMHPNSIRAGYLDLDGCTVVDLLTR